MSVACSSIHLVLAAWILAWMLDARALWQNGEREAAIAQRTSELQGIANSVELRLELARWQLAVHRGQAALDSLQGLDSRADPLRGEAHYKLAQYERAVLLLDEVDLDRALMKLDALEALQRFAESDALLERLPKPLWERDARLWSALGRRWQRAQDCSRACAAFEQALKLDPAESEALFGLGRARLACGQREAGLAALQQHRELLPKLDAWDFARRAVDLAPRHAPNLAALADAERGLGRMDRAAALYRESLDSVKLPSERVPIVLRYARFLEEDQKASAAALTLLVECAQQVADARLWVRAGDLALRTEQRARALEYFQAAHKLRPEDPQIRERVERAGGKL